MTLGGVGGLYLAFCSVPLLAQAFRNRHRLSIAVLFACSLSISTVSAADWPTWRGKCSGLSDAANLPEKWSLEDRIQWRTPIDAQGISSPVLADGRLFLTIATTESPFGKAPFAAMTFGIVAAMTALLSLFWRRHPCPVDRDLLLRITCILDRLAAAPAIGVYAVALVWLYRNRGLFANGDAQPLGTFVPAIVLLGSLAAVWLSRPISRWRLLGVGIHAGAALAFGLFLAKTGVSVKFMLFLGALVIVVIWWLAVWFLARRLAAAQAVGGVADTAADREGNTPTISHWNSWRRRAWFATLSSALILTPVLQIAALLWLPQFERWALSVVCIDPNDGRILWRETCFQERGLSKLQLNSFATPTPCTDGDMVVAQFAPGLVCLDRDGNEKWRCPISEHKALVFAGAAISPLLFDDTVIFAVVPDGRSPKSNEYLSSKSSLTALDKLTGKQKWRVTLPGGHDSYSTPLITRFGDEPLLLMPTWDRLLVYDPRNGDLLQEWNLPIRQCIPTPVADERRAYVMCGQDHGSRGGFAVDLNFNQDTQEPPVAWRLRRDPADIASPVLVDGLLYMVTSNGRAQCVEAESGKILWRERLPGMYFASVVAGDGKVYFTSDAGETTVVRQGREYQHLGTSSIEEPVYASPAISDGQILIRGESALYCIDSENAALP